MEENGRNRRRRERAQQMRCARDDEEDEDSCDESRPIVRSKPPRPRRKSNEPIFEEELIDGFSIFAFKTYEDLERCVRAAEKSGSRYLDPYPNRNVKQEKKTVIAKPKASGSQSSLEQGYICDNESADDRVSDGDDDGLDLFIVKTPLKPRSLNCDDAVPIRSPSTPAAERPTGVGVGGGAIPPNMNDIQKPHPYTHPPKLPLMPPATNYSNGPVEPSSYPSITSFSAVTTTTLTNATPGGVYPSVVTATSVINPSPNLPTTANCDPKLNGPNVSKPVVEPKPEVKPLIDAKPLLPDIKSNIPDIKPNVTIAPDGKPIYVPPNNGFVKSGPVHNPLPMPLQHTVPALPNSVPSVKPLVNPNMPNEPIVPNNGAPGGHPPVITPMVCPPISQAGMGTTESVGIGSTVHTPVTSTAATVASTVSSAVSKYSVVSLVSGTTSSGANKPPVVNNNVNTINNNFNNGINGCNTTNGIGGIPSANSALTKPTPIVPMPSVIHPNTSASTIPTVTTTTVTGNCSVAISTVNATIVTTTVTNVTGPSLPKYPNAIAPVTTASAHPGPVSSLNYPVKLEPGEAKLDVKPDVKMDIKPDIKPDIKHLPHYKSTHGTPPSQIHPSHPHGHPIPTQPHPNHYPPTSSSFHHPSSHVSSSMALTHPQYSLATHPTCIASTHPTHLTHPSHPTMAGHHPPPHPSYLHGSVPSSLHRGVPPHHPSHSTVSRSPSGLPQHSPHHLTSHTAGTIGSSHPSHGLVGSHPPGSMVPGIKAEPGMHSRGTPPSSLGAHGLSSARHSPRTHDPHGALHSISSGSLGTTPSSISKPWVSPVATTTSARLQPLGSRPMMPPSFSMGHPAVSAPLPPSGMFAPTIPISQPLTSTPLIPPSHLTSDPLAQSDLLRRELNQRFLTSQDRTLGLAPTALGGIGSVPTLLRTDVHHHQHQHTHVHQHLLPSMGPPPPLAPPAPSGLFSHSSAPSLFKEVNKVGLDSSLYRPGGSLGTNYPPGMSAIGPSNTAPFAPPSHLPTMPNKTASISDASQRKSVKSGWWNTMHVRIAWEIYYHQQIQAAEKTGHKLGGTDLLRPPGAAPGTASMYPTLPRPPDLGPSLLGGPGPSHRYESPMLGHSQITPSVPGLAGLRYPKGHGLPGMHSSEPTSFHHPGINPTSISGPPPGSMFSREPLPPGLSLPTPNPAAPSDTWRLRAPTPYSGGSSSWPLKPDASFYDREQREHEERDKREREERERREREERERREREERERRERDERREREEREREREKRIEHEKERAARSLEASQDRGAIRRDASRSPLRPDIKEVSPHPSGISHPGLPHPAQPPAPGLSTIPPVPGVKADGHKSDSRPSSRPGSRPGSRPTDTRVKNEKDDVVIVGSKEAPRHPAHPQHPGHPTHPGHMPIPQSHPTSLSNQLLPPHNLPATVSSPLDRSRYLGAGGSYQPNPHPHHMAAWSDPFRDPYRSAAMAAAHDPLSSLNAARAHEQAFMRESFMAREAAFRDPLRSLDRAREEQILRGNPLGSLILNERYKEQQAREMFERERERQYAGAAAAAAAAATMPPGLYPPSSSMLPPPAPHLASSLLQHGMKGPAPLSHHSQLGGPPGLHHQGIPTLHHAPGHPSSLGLGLPPPLIPTLRGSPSSLPRPPDKKDGPR